jgi:hypothetical protein
VEIVVCEGDEPVRNCSTSCQATAEDAFVTAQSIGGTVYGGPKWTVTPTYEGMLKEEMDEAACRHPDVAYRPTRIDAAYAGIRTFDIGGDSSTSDDVDDVLARLRIRHVEAT